MFLFFNCNKHGNNNDNNNNCFIIIFIYLFIIIIIIKNVLYSTSIIKLKTKSTSFSDIITILHL